MSIKTITLVPVAGTAPQQRARASRLERLQARFRAAYRAGRERARERRQARLTAEALQHLGPRELRDIGLVRLTDVHPTRYLRIHDFG